MSIINLLNQIKNTEIVLPAIQRDFVWSEDKVLKLLDSVMRGYPIGIALLWETYLDLQYRAFDKDFRSDQLHSFAENKRKKKLKLVLDGQQRLQSLFIALYGSYNGASLYFDVLSGRESDDVGDSKYEFKFMDGAGYEKWLRSVDGAQRLSPVGSNPEVPLQFFVKASDLFASGVRERTVLSKRVIRQFSLCEADQERLEMNLARFDEALTKNPNILKVSVIDEDLPSDNPDRKSESDVLEIFVRVNREGTALRRSDLVFSLLRLNWRESAETLPAFVHDINKGNSFDIDTDFVIRCLFAVSDLGTKFDLDRLRRKQSVDRLKGNFAPCCDAIKSVLDAVSRHCWCSSSSIFGGLSTLVPFVYWLFHMPDHELPTDSISSFRKSFYLFAFARPFSRYADSRLGKFIADELQPRIGQGSFSFPFDNAVRWVKYWERHAGFDAGLLQSNIPLTHHVVQNLSSDRVHYKRNHGELDHIFPRSVLREKGVQESEINHFANFWILARSNNQRKSNEHPAQFFKSVDPVEVKRALIDLDHLDYRRFNTFVKRREEQIVSAVKRRLQFKDSDFDDPEQALGE